MKTSSRTNLYISAECRAILSALGAASTGKPSMAAGLSELVSRVRWGIETVPTAPGPKASYRATWRGEDGEQQATEFAYPDRPSAIAAAVLLKFEADRIVFLASITPPDETPDEGAAVLAEQHSNYNAMIGESIRRE